MKQEVLFIILNEYADWESAFLAASLARAARSPFSIMMRAC